MESAYIILWKGENCKQEIIRTFPPTFPRVAIPCHCIWQIIFQKMSGFTSVNRYTLRMTLSEQDILRILMRSRDRIAAAAWVVLRDAHAAEDIFQNVAIKALKQEIDFPAEGALLSWAFITARREAIDWLRRHRRELTGLDTEILELLEQDWLSETAQQGETRIEALRSCLNTLPAKSSQFLHLRYFEGHKCGEVAETLGMGLDAVYKRLSRVHQGLKTCIELRLQKLEAPES
ncbi:MAG: sigma-70 family RNA polymerase sigma factor [Desulfobacterales bacterium]|nr:sigma-70 family RNA polymerase sigma factor [Desulfobacterales bacterium]